MTKAQEGTLKKIKKILRMFDFFGESFTFRYKDEDKHSSALSGIICISFYIFAFAYIVINFIPYSQSKNFTVQYYSINSNNTENINLTKAPISFGFGLTNENKNPEYNIYDLFEITVSFTEKKKDYVNKTITIIESDKCTKQNDFHNLDIINESLVENLYCIERNNTPKGIFTDDEFSYYTISVASKDKDNETHNKLINEYLIENDCKLQFYYTDIEMDVNNKTNFFKAFFNSIFLQLNPTLIQKKNIFYMNYNLTDDNNTLVRFGKFSKEINETKTGLSRVEDYSLYKGLERAVNKPEDYEYYAKIYIRADNRKIDIN